MKIISVPSPKTTLFLLKNSIVNKQETEAIMSEFNPLDNFDQSNKEYLDTLFKGNMNTVLVVCHACKNVYMTERGPSIEFNSSYCPFCESPRKSSTVTLDTSNVKESIGELSSKLEQNEETKALANKIKRVMLEGKKQRYNVAACSDCNNRFIFLEEDFDEVACCAFCGHDRDNMSALLEYDVKRTPEEYTAAGFEKYIGKVFYLKIKNGIEDNFILTDVDSALKRYRYQAVVDDRMAIWVKDDDIIDMFEFIHTDHINPNVDPPDKDTP